MDWKRGEVASFCQSLLLKTSPRVKFLLGLGGWGSVLLGWAGLVLSGHPSKVPFGGWGWGWGAGGLGASGLDGPSAFRQHKKPCPPSIRKRCACGFPQGTAEPLRHASNKATVLA